MRKAPPKVKKRSPLYVGSIQVLVRIPPEKFAKLDAWIDSGLEAADLADFRRLAGI